MFAILFYSKCEIIREEQAAKVHGPPVGNNARL